MITSKKARDVAKIFDEAGEYESHHVEMWETNVVKSKACGTVACHGGWYALMTARTANNYRWHTNENLGYKILRNDKDIPVGFLAGRRQMAQDLGFETPEELEDWARHNPEIWGNIHGLRMFASNTAFGIPNDDTMTLKQIARHWHNVADRLEELEQ